MRPRKKILIILAGVITALLLIANSFISFNTTANLSQDEKNKKELTRHGFLLFH